jgi:hypothetical protein
MVDEREAARAAAVARAMKSWNGRLEDRYVNCVELASGFLCTYSEPGVRGFPYVYVGPQGGIRRFPSAFTLAQVEEALARPQEHAANTSSSDPLEEEGDLTAEQLVWLDRITSGEWRAGGGPPPPPPV